LGQGAWFKRRRRKFGLWRSVGARLERLKAGDWTLSIANVVGPVADGRLVGHLCRLRYAFLAACKLTRPPGDTFEYSNLGFGLLGHALGLRAGLDYEALIRARILAPLGTAATAVHLQPDLAHRLGSGT
jgi:CubicO group peptidase (beta-lactamase class C family)